MLTLPDTLVSHTLFEPSHWKVCEAYPKTEKIVKNVPFLHYRPP